MSLTTEAPEVLKLLSALSIGNCSTQHRFGKYEVIRMLSCTGQAIVLLSRDSVLDRNVVLKSYPSVADGIGPMHEGRAISQVSSPFVAKCYGVDQIDGLSFLVLEYVEGTTLSEILSQDRPTIQETISYLRDICNGLSAVHTAGLVHGDLKPGNVIIDKDGRGRLIDFGLARPMSGPPRLCGTAAYMPPEIARCDATVPSPAGDVFGIGAILHHCLTGQPPFSAATANDSIERARSGNVDTRILDSTGPTWLVRLAVDCLAKDPKRRPKSAKAVLSRLPAGQSRGRWTLVLVSIALLGVLLAYVAPVQQLVDDKPSLWEATPTTSRQVELVSQGKFEEAYFLEKKRDGIRHPGDQFEQEERCAMLAECIPNYELAIAHQARAISITGRGPKLTRYAAASKQRLKELKRRREDSSAESIDARRAFYELWLNSQIVGINGNWDREKLAEARALCQQHDKLFGPASFSSLEAKLVLQRWYLRYHQEQDGLGLAREVFSGLKSTVGPTDYLTALAACDLADHGTRARAPDQVTLAEEAVSLALDVLGKANSLTLRAYTAAATAAQQTKQTGLAREHLEAALQIASAIRPSAEPVLYVKQSLVSVTAGEFDRAVEEAQAAKAALSDQTPQEQQVQTKFYVTQQLFRAAAFAGNAELAKSVAADLEKLLAAMPESARHQFGARRRLLDGAHRLGLDKLVRSQRSAIQQLLDDSLVPKHQVSIAEKLLAQTNPDASEKPVGK